MTEEEYFDAPNPMSGFGVITFPIFTLEQVKEINKQIKKNIFQKESQAKGAKNVSKIGDFFHIPCPPLMKLLHSWLYECQLVNRENFGYDIYWDFHLEGLKYNVYGIGGEYGYHIDCNAKSLYDVKLTCLLNLSEEPYEGGEFFTINNPDGKTEFITGMGLVFNSLIAHKVSPVTKGERITLTYWALGPSWR